MTSMGKTILMIAILLCLAGCTIHFKAKELELDTELKEPQTNCTYELEKIVLFDG